MSHIEFYCLLNSTYKKTSWFTSTHSALNIILASFNRLPYSGWEEGGPKRPPYQFFPCNFYRCTISAKRFWLLLWTLLLHYCKMSMPYLLPGSNYWTWTKSSSQKKRFSGHIEKIYKTEVMITSLIEKLEFPHITLVTWTHLQYSLNHVINFFGNILDRNYDIITFISKYFILRRPRGANLADIIKIATIFMKATFKYSKKKIKELNIMS